MSRVFIIGATGGVGSRLAAHLLELTGGQTPSREALTRAAGGQAIGTDHDQPARHESWRAS